MENIKLSYHFYLSEFIRSENAARAGIDNTPSPEVLERLKINAEYMERVRNVLAAPVIVSSGYRCEALEKLLTVRDFRAYCLKHHVLPEEGWPIYFKRKQHPKGSATDFESPAYGTPAAVCLAIAATDLPFDQLILEHTWAHVSWPEVESDARRQVLTLMPTGYAEGILEQKAA